MLYSTTLPCPVVMSNQNSQKTGTLHSLRELGPDMFTGRLDLLDGTQRPCVIHFAPAGDELARARLLREGAIGYDVTRDQRHLLTTLCYGEWPDGRAFLAVDGINGTALSQHRDSLRGDFGEIRIIVTALILALVQVHHSGVVHGGLSMSNVLIGADGVIRLGDFSQAYRVAEWDASNKKIIGDIAPGAFRPDIRALGHVLFELVVGAPRSDSSDLALHLPADAPADLCAILTALLDEDLADVSLAELLQMIPQASDRGQALAEAVAPKRVSPPGSLPSPRKIEFTERDTRNMEGLVEFYKAIMLETPGDADTDSERRAQSTWKERWPVAVAIIALILSGFSLWRGPVIKTIEVPAKAPESVPTENSPVHNDEPSAPSPEEPAPQQPQPQPPPVHREPPAPSPGDVPPLLQEERSPTRQSSSRLQVSPRPGGERQEAPNPHLARETAGTTLHFTGTVTNSDAFRVTIDQTNLDTDGIVLQGHIQNNSGTPFQAAHVSLAGQWTNDDGMLVNFFPSGLGCTETGMLPAGFQCGFTLHFSRMDLLAGGPIKLLISGPNGALNVTLQRGE